MNDRIHLPKLNNDQLGVKGLAGWFMDELQTDKFLELRYPIFQSPCCNERRSFKDHTIEPSGVINNSILCLCGQYHIWGFLDDWPPELKKVAGKLTVEPSNL